MPTDQGRQDWGIEKIGFDGIKCLLALESPFKFIHSFDKFIKFLAFFYVLGYKSSDEL